MTTETAMSLRERVGRLLWPEAEFKTYHGRTGPECEEWEPCLACTHAGTEAAEYLSHHHASERTCYRLPTLDMWLAVPAFEEDSTEGFGAARLLVERLREQELSWRADDWRYRTTDPWVVRVRIYLGDEKPNVGKAPAFPEALALAFCEAMEAPAHD